MEEFKGDKFAGKTASGSKVHRCHRRTGSACWDYTSNRMPYFAPVKGRVRRQYLPQRVLHHRQRPQPQHVHLQQPDIGDRRQVELMAQESTHPADVWFSLVVRDALAAFGQPGPVRILMSGSGDEVDRLAFTQWAQSAACREGYTAIFTAFDKDGNRLSRFAIGGQVPHAATVDTSLVFDNIMEVSVRESEGTTKVYSGMTAIQSSEGSLLGFAQVTVAAGPQVLFRGETPVFLRGAARQRVADEHQEPREHPGRRLRVQDLPSYHYWLNRHAELRQRDIGGWITPLMPIRGGISIVLRLLRASLPARRSDRRQGRLPADARRPHGPNGPAARAAC